MPSNEFDHAAFDVALAHVHVTDAQPALLDAPATNAAVAVDAGARLGGANVDLIVEDAWLLSPPLCSCLAAPLKQREGVSETVEVLPAPNQPREQFVELTNRCSAPAGSRGGCLLGALGGLGMLLRRRKS